MKHFVSYFNDSVKNNWDLPAVTNFGKETYTYAQIAEGIAKYHILFKETGIAEGDKIALYARNSAEWCVAYFATLTYGAVTVPFLPDFIPAAVAELASFSECKMVIVDDIALNGMKSNEEYIAQIEKVKGFVALVNIKDMSLAHSLSDKVNKVFESIESKYSKMYPDGITAADVNYYPQERDMDALVEISFTSGTTSATSKGVMLPARSLSVNLEFGKREIPSCVGGHIFAILPMAHMFGQTFDVLFPLSSGCHVYVMPGKPTPARLLGGLGAVKPFMFLTVPMVIEKVFKSKVIPTLKKPAMRIALAIPGLNKLILRGVRNKLYNTFGGNLLHGVIIGGAALNKEVEMWMKKMKFPYCVGYGMTECGPIISFRHWTEFTPTSCGALVRYLELRIDSNNPAKVLGEIQVKGDNVMLGYYKNEEATRAVFTKDGWMRTGDMGLFDKKENVFIKGRCKNMILSASGQNIYPEEIEDKLNNIPYVVESLAVGRKNAIIGLIVPNWDAVKADGLTREELEKMIREEIKKINVDLPAYSRVNDIELRPDPFEKTPKQSIKRFMYQ